jgi:hypothetical protein
VDRDEVALSQQLVQADQAHPDLRRPRGADVRVVRQQPGAEGRHALCEQHPDPAQTHDPDGFVGDLDAGPAGALPPAGLQGGAGRRGVAGTRQQQRHRLLGGADDVGQRGVDDHHAAGGRSRHIHVVEADAGPRHDLEPRRCVEGLGVDPGSAPHQHGVGVRERRQQRGPVGAVDMPHRKAVTEHLEHGGRQLLGDQHDRQGHGGPRGCGSSLLAHRWADAGGRRA